MSIEAVFFALSLLPGRYAYTGMVEQFFAPL
jgi:hypothetical protein